MLNILPVIVGEKDHTDHEGVEFVYLWAKRGQGDGRVAMVYGEVGYEARDMATFIARHLNRQMGTWIWDFCVPCDCEQQFDLADDCIHCGSPLDTNWENVPTATWTSNQQNYWTARFNKEPKI